MTPQEAVDYLMLKAKESSAKLTKSVDPEALKGHLHINKNSQSYNQSFQTRSQWYQPFTTLSQGAANMASTTGQSQDKIDEAEGQEATVASQTDSTSQQSVSEGESQTQNLAETLRSDSTSIANDMSTDANSYRAA